MDYGASLIAQRMRFVYNSGMPYRPKTVELPEWIYELAAGDDCVLDVLTEAWVAGQHARHAIDERGNTVPRVCSHELETAEAILEAIRDGRVQPSMLSSKAAQAVRKFTTARQCARSVESDDSPRFASERPLQRRR